MDIKQQAHFAIHIDTTKVSVIDKLKQATDGKLLWEMKKFAYHDPNISYDDLWQHIDTCFNNIRNYYAHTIEQPNKTTAITKTDTDKQAYEITKNFLKYAYQNIPDPDGRKKILFDLNDDITQDGIIFFACTVSTRAMANRFIGGISGYKRTDEFGQQLRNIMLYYAYRDSYNLLASGTQENTYNWRKAMEILDYIRKPINGTYQAQQAEQNRATKDENDVHINKYDIRTQKNLFPYFACNWLENEYTDNAQQNISFLRKNGCAETKYKPDGKTPKKRKPYVIDKWNDTEYYDLNMPLYMPYRGTAVVAVIKSSDDIHSVLLSDMDLFYMILLKLDNKLDLNTIISNQTHTKAQKTPNDLDKRFNKRIALIKSRWQDCENWTTREKINRIMWAFQNLIFSHKICDVKTADMLRLEIINYQGRKHFKRFMRDYNVTSPHNLPPENRLHTMLSVKDMGLNTLLISVRNAVVKWCDLVSSGEKIPESDKDIYRILNIKENPNSTTDKTTLSFLNSDFWKQHIKSNITLEYLASKNIQGFNEHSFYRSDMDKKSKTSDQKFLPKKIFKVYLKDIILHKLAQDLIQKQTNTPQNNVVTSSIELVGKKQCTITYSVKSKGNNKGNNKSKDYVICVPLHHLGKSYVMDYLPSGVTKKHYLATLFTYIEKQKEKQKNTSNPDMMDIISARQDLQQGMHDFCWRWLQCEQKLLSNRNKCHFRDNGTLAIDDTLKEYFPDYQQKEIDILRIARNKCLHSNIWDMQYSAKDGTLTKAKAFETLSDLEKKLKIKK